MGKIARRTVLLSEDGVRFVRHLHRDEALSMLGADTIDASEEIAGKVVSFRLTGKRTLSTVRPGSFGIERQHLNCGAVIFAHHSLHEVAA